MDREISRRYGLRREDKRATMAPMNASADDLFKRLRDWGASDASWTRVTDGPPSLSFALSVAVRLSDAVVEEIDAEPTYTYFHHYRTVNAFLDGLTLRAGLWLQERGARYIAVAASQSVPGAGGQPPAPFEGRYSHKKAACMAGLGAMGRSNLFLHNQWGPRVRLATLFTDWQAFDAVSSAGTGHTEPGSAAGARLSGRCASCGLCVSACPAGAIGEADGRPVFDPEKCSAWMKKKYQHIGRGAVCGICMRVCPVGTVR